jgi:hypothetical protein
MGNENADNTCDISENDKLYIANIADRVIQSFGYKFGDKVTIRVLLFSVNKTCPLDFEALFEADDFTFAHDIFGIYNNVDDTFTRLNNLFLPRCSKRSLGK